MPLVASTSYSSKVARLKSNYPNTKGFKVVLKDNFDRDYIADILLVEDISGKALPTLMSAEDAVYYAEQYNVNTGDCAPYFAVAEPEEYELNCPYDDL